MKICLDRGSLRQSVRWANRSRSGKPHANNASKTPNAASAPRSGAGRASGQAARDVVAGEASCPTTDQDKVSEKDMQQR